jgi:hypothetical protein
LIWWWWWEGASGWTDGRKECPGKHLMELIVRKERIVTPTTHHHSFSCWKRFRISEGLMNFDKVIVRSELRCHYGTDKHENPQQRVRGVHRRGFLNEERRFWWEELFSKKELLRSHWEVNSEVMIGMRYEDGVIQTNFISRFHHD